MICNPDAVPAQAGSYLIEFWLDSPAVIQVGKSGQFTFTPGRYIYCGSAFGPGGLAARIRRHLNPISRPHWHIDFLHPPMLPTGVAFQASLQRLECIWSRALLDFAEAVAPVAGFGSSDCRNGCFAHLVHFPGADPSFEQICEQLHLSKPVHR